ncbi:RING-H2 finger protein [Quillaja saponaria]|uniref:RING-type E3 ubiquitin transferase n=1 Tax=Quillaja saponaria TaxID=32244 RepID=A0AAD7KQ50_QUISA|nr:RING-H2 finger protein [Quillaja saponaria]
MADYQKQSIPSPSSSSASEISPAILFIVVILAVIFFLSCLLHFLVRYLMKKTSSSISESNRYPEMSGSHAFRRQLQQLFHLHDSGLDQAFIDALPVFVYKEIIGLKEPFDCAICLCEFSEPDKLRLIPLCNHAFHIDCIDTWLLSNSTCPLCRGTLYGPGLAIENPILDFEDPREEDGFSANQGSVAAAGWKPAENSIVSGKRVFSVRLGKFRSSNNGEGMERAEEESSNSNLDVRRCYSMGSFQYVVADSDLQVALCPNRDDGSSSDSRRHLTERTVVNENSSTDGSAEGKKLNSRSKDESFSVSKIWQWSKKGKFPSSSERHMVTSVVIAGLPQTNMNVGYLKH